MFFFLHHLFDILNNLLFLSSYADSHTVGISTEHVVIGPYLLTTLRFELGSVTALPALQGDQSQDSGSGWQIFERF